VSCYRDGVVRRHRRFALLDVTFAGQPLTGATIDAWEDDDGQDRWAARALMPFGQQVEEGLLEGRTKDGSRVSGQVRVASRQDGPRGPRTVLVELHGSGLLIEPGLEPAPPEPATPEGDS
jgi:hypothetical protein